MESLVRFSYTETIYIGSFTIYNIPSLLRKPLTIHQPWNLRARKLALLWPMMVNGMIPTWSLRKQNGWRTFLHVAARGGGGGSGPVCSA